MPPKQITALKRRFDVHVFYKLVSEEEYFSDESGPTSRSKTSSQKSKLRRKHVIESDEDDVTEPSDTPSGGMHKSDKVVLARRRGSRPFPKRQEQLKPSVLGDDSTEDNDRSSDEDYHLSDEDKPKRPKHRGKPSWATKPIPKAKKPEYAVDRKINGLSQEEGSDRLSKSETAKLNHNNFNINSSISNNKNPQNGGTKSKLDEVLPPAGSAEDEPDPEIDDELPVSEEDIATLGNVDDLVNYVVQDDV